MIDPDPTRKFVTLTRIGHEDSALIWSAIDNARRGLRVGIMASGVEYSRLTQLAFGEVEVGAEVSRIYKGNGQERIEYRNGGLIAFFHPTSSRGRTLDVALIGESVLHRADEIKPALY